MKLFGILRRLLKDNNIPEFVDNQEKLVRFIFSPHNIKNNKLRSNAYMPPIYSNEVSVTRLKYSSADRCKLLANRVINLDSTGEKKIYGFSIVSKAEALNCGIYDVKSLPTNENNAHANILYQVLREREPSAEMQKCANELIKIQRLYSEERNTNVYKWCGEELI